MIVRGLVLDQPYAWAMFHGKDVENRSRATHHRGPLVIMAGLQRQRFEQGALELRKRGLEPPSEDSLDYGGIIGAVDVWDVVAPSVGTFLPPSGFLWHFPSHWGWRTRTPVELPFRPYRGHQGIVHVKLTSGEVELLQRAGLLAA